MTIDGNIKVFELSKALFKNGDSVVASSGTLTADNIIDFNAITRWLSEGSTDSTVETLTITFNTPGYISRLLLLNHNFKSYTVRPIIGGNILDSDLAEVLDSDGNTIQDSGGDFEFLNVTSFLDSVSGSGISESGYSISNSYYEFDKVYVEGLIIEITEAQETIGLLVDQEKSLYRCIPTIELNDNVGTFQSFPELLNPTDFNAVVTKILHGPSNVSKQTPVFSALLSLENNNVQNDIELMEFLRYYPFDFLIWPNGGKFTEDFFRFNASPYKTTDIYQVQVINSSMVQYFNNIYSNIASSSIGLIETI